MVHLTSKRWLPFALAAGWALGGAAASAQTVPLTLDRFGLLVASQSRPSFAILGAGARAAGMGGAFTALADDASAASFNPAGLALLVTPEVSFAFDARERHDDHAPFTVLTSDGADRYTGSRDELASGGLNFAAFTLPFTVAERNLTVQLFTHRLVDFTFDGSRTFQQLEESGEATAAYRQRIDQDGAISTVGLAAAYQWTQRLSLGLTLAHWQGDWSFATETRETEVASGDETVLRFEQDHEWSGWNATVGLLLRYRYLNVGASTRLPFDGAYRVDSRLLASTTTPFEPESSFDGRLRWPSSYTLGLALKPTETWIVTADYAEYDWDDMVIHGLGTEDLNFFDLAPESRSTTANRGQWRFGTELTLLPGESVIGLRAGYTVEPRPERLGRSAEAANATTWALGVGWSWRGWSIDVAWQQLRSRTPLPEFVDPDAALSGELLSLADAEVSSRDQRVFVSLLYRFPSRAALGRLFHFLFVGPLDSPGGEAAD